MGFQGLISDLQAGRGIDEEDMVTFKFFKISRSKVLTYSDEPEKIMLAIVDISQKILYDTSKAQTELLSLINSSISHEMRNPLNSIINECQIMGIMIKSLTQILLQIRPILSEVHMLDQIDDIIEKIKRGNCVQTSSSQMLLLNVEDILGYAQI